MEIEIAQCVIRGSVKLIECPSRSSRSTRVSHSVKINWDTKFFFLGRERAETVEIMLRMNTESYQLRG